MTSSKWTQPRPQVSLHPLTSRLMMLIGLIYPPILSVYAHRRREDLRAEHGMLLAEFLQLLPSYTTYSGHGTQLSWTAHPHLRYVTIIEMAHDARSCSPINSQEPRLPSRIVSQFLYSFHQTPFPLMCHSAFDFGCRQSISDDAPLNNRIGAKPGVAMAT
jgi:hypothetical protein